MSTRIVDLELDSAPEVIPLAGHDRLWVIAWRDGIPVGTTLLRAAEGESHVRAEAAREALREIAANAPEPQRLPGGGASRISVVICTRDRPDRLPIALAALKAQTRRDFELVIVDNAPTDDRTRRVVEEHYPEAVYVVEPIPGLPRARNAGIRAATGEILAFTDDDCRPIPRWVERIAGSFAAEPRLGCVTGPILPLELESEAQEAMESRGGFNRGFERVLHTPWKGDSPVYPVQAWSFGAGGSMALSRACLRDIGGFDEALWRSEDMDIFYQALRAGYCLVFDPGVAVRHRHLPTWGQLARRMFHWGWGYLTYLDKIARTDTEEYAQRARAERRNWVRYQLRDRFLPALRGQADLPLPLVALEIAGGLAGMWGYGIAQRQAARRVRAPADLQPT